MSSLTVDFVPQNHSVTLSGEPATAYFDQDGTSSGMDVNTDITNLSNGVTDGYVGMAGSQHYSGQIRINPSGSAAYWTIFISLNDTSVSNEFDFLMRQSDGSILSHGLSLSTVYGSNSWWTIETRTSIHRIYVVRTDTAWSESATLPVLKYYRSGTAPRFLDDQGNSGEIGIQGLAISTTAQPRNCFHPSVRVEVGLAGEAKAVSELVSGDEVAVMDGVVKRLVKVTLLRSRQPSITKVASWTSTPYKTSPDHLLLAPSQDVSGVKRWCKRCRSGEGTYGKNSGCVYCSPVQCEGFSPLVARDFDGVTYSYETIRWYHLILADPHISKPICLEGGWLSEGFRHPYGTQKRSDYLFEKVE